MKTPQSSVFPFMNYYPFLFCSSWNYPATPASLISEFRSKKSQTFVSLIRKNQTCQKEDKEDPQVQPKQVCEVVKKSKEKFRIKKKKVILNQRQERQEDYSRKKQKKDRNLPSNIFKILTGLIYSNQRMARELRNICERREGVTHTRIIQVFKSIIMESQSYIRPATIQSLYLEGKLTRQQSLVFRVFLKNFLLVEFPVMIVQQPKLKKSQKLAYVKLAKSLFSQLNMGFFK